MGHDTDKKANENIRNKQPVLLIIRKTTDARQRFRQNNYFFVKEGKNSFYGGIPGINPKEN